MEMSRTAVFRKLTDRSFLNATNLTSYNKATWHLYQCLNPRHWLLIQFITKFIIITRNSAMQGRDDKFCESTGTTWLVIQLLCSVD